MEIINQEVRKANKDHKCGFCGEIITKGTHYDFQTNKIEGAIYHFKSHTDCSAVARVLGMYDYCDGWLDEDTFQDLIREEYFEHVSNDNDEHDDDEFKDQLDFVLKKRL